MPKITDTNRIGKSYLYNGNRRDKKGRVVKTAKDVARDNSHERVKAVSKELAKKCKEVLGTEGYLVATVECDGVAVASTKDGFSLQGEGENHALPVFQDSRVVKRIDTDEVVHSDKGAEEMTHDGNYGRQIEIVTADHKPNGERLSPIEFVKALEIIPQLIADKAIKDPHNLIRIDYHSVPFRGFMDQANACQFNVNLEGGNGKNLFDNGKGYESALHLLFAEEMLEFQAAGGLLIFTPNDSGFARLKRHGPTEPDANFIGIRKGLNNFPTLFLRGPNRDVARAEDPRQHKHQDKGGVRTEIRGGSPECITMKPESSPSLVVETIMRVMIRALDRYAAMSPTEREALSAEGLWNIPRRPFPKDFSELKQQFIDSTYIAEHYPELKQRALDVINTQPTTHRRRAAKKENGSDYLGRPA